MRECGFINSTVLPDYEFYSRAAESFGRKAVHFIATGQSFLAGWYAERAASYALHLEATATPKLKSFSCDRS